MRFLRFLLLLAISVGFSSRSQSASCDEGWLQFGNDCYFFNHDTRGKATWMDANKVCHFLGSHLADIRNEAEWQFVKGKLQPWRQYMIGITDKDCEGSWRYSDGGGDAFVKWRSDQPDNGKLENCGALFSEGGLYNDLICTTDSSGLKADYGTFICKKAPQ